MEQHTKQQNRTRKAAIALLAGLAAAGIIGASAASLNGITTDSLGADKEVVGSCDDDGVVVTYDASYDAGDGRVEVNSINVSDVNDACDGLNYEVTLLDAGNAELGQASGNVPAILLSTDFDVTFADVDAELVEGIAITIFQG